MTARHLARTTIAALALATQGLGAHADDGTLGPAGGFAGDWAGTNRLGLRVEARIEGVTGNGSITGSACWQAESGFTRGGRLEGRARVMKGGGLAQARFGTAIFTASVVSEDQLRLRESRVGGDKKRTIKTILTRPDQLRCAHRFAKEPVELVAGMTESTEGLVGYWNGKWGNGNIHEVAIERADDTGQAEGRWCTRATKTGAILIMDFHDQGPMYLSFKPEANEITVERQASATHRHRQRYTLGEPGTLEHESTSNIGRDNERKAAMTLKRGTHPDGCMRYILPKTRARGTARGTAQTVDSAKQ